MNRFGELCPVCPDGLAVLRILSAKISVTNPETGQPTPETQHTGPAIVAPPGHTMVIHRGLETKTVNEGEIASLCAGDVVRVLPSTGQ